MIVSENSHGQTFGKDCRLSKVLCEILCLNSSDDGKQQLN